MENHSHESNECCDSAESSAMVKKQDLHVLMVSNHWALEKKYASSGIFVSRQVASLRDAGVKISTFDIGTTYSPLHILKMWWVLKQNVRKLRPDIVHAQYGTIVGVLAVFAAKPVVVSFCGNDLLRAANTTRMRALLGCLLSNIAALRATAIICKSKQLKESLWWRQNVARVIPNGVDLYLFSPGSQDEARKELAWDGDYPVALFHGRYPRLKGLDIVERAMERVRCRIPDARLKVIHDVEPARMPIYYRAADVLVCASLAEGSPNMVKEALACNLPVVSTDVGDVAERLEGVCPSHVVPRDPIAISEAVTKILLDRKRCNGRESVRCLNVEHVARRIINVYCKAISL